MNETQACQILVGDTVCGKPAEYALTFSVVGLDGRPLPTSEIPVCPHHWQKIQDFRASPMPIDRTERRVTVVERTPLAVFGTEDDFLEVPEEP